MAHGYWCYKEKNILSSDSLAFCRKSPSWALLVESVWYSITLANFSACNPNLGILDDITNFFVVSRTIQTNLSESRQIAFFWLTISQPKRERRKTARSFEVICLPFCPDWVLQLSALWRHLYSNCHLRK